MANKKIKGTNKKLLTRSRKYQNGGLTLQTNANVLSPQQMKEFGVVPQLQGIYTSGFEGSGSGGMNMGMAGGIASLASAATTDILNVINEAKGADLTDIKTGITRSQIDTSVKSFDDIQNQYSKLTTGRTWTAKDLGAKGAGKMIGGSFAQAAKGAMAGSSLGPWGMIGGAIGGQVSSLFGSILGNRKRKKQARELNELQRSMDRFNLRTLAGQSQAVGSDISRNLNINYAALGGPMDFGGGAIGYDFMSQYLNTKELAALGQDASLSSLPNSFAKGGRIHIKESNKGKFTNYCGGDVTAECIARGKRSSSPAIRKRATFADNARKWKHAFGGDLLTHGANFDTGVTLIGNGGTHEENPYEGVPMGVDSEGIPNLVEQGEVIFKDYVFSNRLTVPKTVGNKYKLRGTKPLTFADAAKQLSKEAEERPNDPVSKAGLEALMSRLASDQEGFKAEKENRKFANGGHLFDKGGERVRNTYGYVKGYNMGWFGKDGKYTQDYLNKVNNMTPEQLAKAFNAQYAFYIDPANKDSDRRKAIDKFYTSNPQFKIADITLTPEEVEWAKRGAQDYKPGFMHQFFMDAEVEDTPERLAKSRYWLRGENGPTPLDVTPWEGLNEQGQTFAEAYPNLRFYGKQERPYDEATNTTFTDYFYDPLKEETPEEEPDVTSPEYKKLHTWMRYAPVVGLGLGVLADSLGWTNKPDYGNADAILEATSGAGNYLPVKASPIGNYLTYKPFDRNYFLNQLHSQQGATRRALLQNAGLNRGNASAALLAADYNAGLQEGTLARQAEEYNLAQRQQTEEFNRATNMFNVEKALQADMANQSAQASMRDFKLKGTMAAAEMREKARLASEAAKSSNISGFINAIGDIGRENMAWNWRNFGSSTGSFGNVGDAEAELLTHTGRKKKAKEEKIKGKKGLTY